MKEHAEKQEFRGWGALFPRPKLRLYRSVAEFTGWSRNGLGSPKGSNNQLPGAVGLGKLQRELREPSVRTLQISTSRLPVQIGL